MTERTIAFTAVLATLVVWTPPAAAYSDGVSGFSGDPATGGATCNSCHDGGVEPVLTLAGPTTVAPGSTNTYTLTIAGGQQRAGGLDVSASDGTLVVSDPGTWLLDGEIVHTQPRPVSIGTFEAVWSFNWTAPLTAGSATLYGCGNSVNLHQAFSGDRASTDTLTINVGLPGTPGEASGDGLDPLRVVSVSPGSNSMALTYGVACEATDHDLYFGPLSDVDVAGWSGEICGIGTSGAYEFFSPGEGSFFFVVVGNRNDDEGSYGTVRARNGTTTERPAYPSNACARIQNLSAACD
jgi:hypothetical protein